MGWTEAGLRSGSRISGTSTSARAGRAKFLGADHRQQLELVVAVTAGRGGEDQQGLVLVEVVQHLAVHLEHAQLGGPDAFLVAARDRYLVLAPNIGELGTDFKQPL